VDALRVVTTCHGLCSDKAMLRADVRVPPFVKLTKPVARPTSDIG